MGQYIPDITERFPEGFGGVDLTDSFFIGSSRGMSGWYGMEEYLYDDLMDDAFGGDDPCEDEEDGGNDPCEDEENGGDDPCEDDGDDSHIGCKDCPDDECTGHCMSCRYRPV